MGIFDAFRRLRKLIRGFDALELAPESTQTGIRPTVESLKNDADCIAFIRKYAEHENIVVKAVAKVMNPVRLATLALDPDLQPYIRIAALGRLGANDDVRIRIARSDHDPAVAISALQTLLDKSRIKEAADAKHEVVRLYASIPALH
jgi:hypothetical protein